jgi:hypothetical protein
MDHTLIRIKRAVLARRFRFSAKAKEELQRDGLDEEELVESILYASFINKVIRSTSPFRENRREMLYIIISPTLTGLLIYTKGKLTMENGQYVFYFLVSCKRAV